MKKSILFYALFLIVICNSIGQNKRLHLKTFSVVNDTVKIDSVSITPFNFKVFNNSNIEIDTSKFNIDFGKSLLVLKKPHSFTSLNIQYTSYPKFLTKTYTPFDQKLILPSSTNASTFYSLSNSSKIPFTPFEGLNTAGNITRGFTVGNNQNGVSNSSLDLQITGKLSENVTLKASIIDTNLPIQENGNTYELNEFDRVFIELSSQNWRINAGDIYLNNSETNFLNFNKKVSGLGVNASVKNEKTNFDIQTSGALVKGKYKKIQFNGSEGNQGPYQLSDFKNKYVLILSGTEKIYVNGQLLNRGETKDYVIDYNNSELTFNATYPITSDMRITAEYQYSDRVYTRFVSYNSLAFTNEKLKVSTYFYSENDLKNRPIEQDLSDPQKQILSNAGNDFSQMVAPSAYAAPFSENKILYKKSFFGTEEIFEYSTNEQDELFNVSFSYVGENNGDYMLEDVIATGKIYKFSGTKLGNYNPVIQLVAPNKLQIAVVKAEFNPSKKTSIITETALSNNDENLFSTIDDKNNTGLASKFGWNQVLLQKKLTLKSSFNLDYISDKFKSVERLNPVEFNRDWNIETSFGNQTLIRSSIELSKTTKNYIQYNFENLKINENYTGYKHGLSALYTANKLNVTVNSSILNNEDFLNSGSFIRNNIRANYNLQKSWLGALFESENNERKLISTSSLQKNSHAYNQYEGFFGIGDSTTVFMQIGAIFRTTDSIYNQQLNKVNASKTFYLNSTLINTNRTKLNAYINYRTVDNTFHNDEESINSRIAYSQQFFNQFLNISSSYQTLSGTLPQQDYSYIQTEPGQGYYTWIDYNNNNTKELNEFEIAQFSDEATYLRIILPTVNYIPTHQNKFTQTVVINPQQWNQKNGIKKFVSKLSNRTAIIVDNKQQKTLNKTNLNPFEFDNNNVLGLNYNLNNSLFFNRGLKKYSTTFNYIKSKNKNSTTIDDLSSTNELRQLQIEHKLGDFWQLNFSASTSQNTTTSLNYSSRNFNLKNEFVNPSFSYYYNDKTYFSFYVELKNKQNSIGELETLKQQKIGASFNFSKNENSLLKADFNLFKNDFIGNAYSPVAYQMLEGLQPGNNYTWSLLFTKKINSYLHLNLNYLGRKSETSNAIHTGSIQLKALF
jgi:hypothetical protein